MTNTLLGEKMNKELITKNACWFFHKWVTVEFTGYTRYKICLKCNSRRITQPDDSGVYQPIDFGFLTRTISKIDIIKYD